MINKSNMKQTKTYEMPLSEVRSTRIRACILAGSTNGSSGPNPDNIPEDGGGGGTKPIVWAGKQRGTFPFK